MKIRFILFILIIIIFGGIQTFAFAQNLSVQDTDANLLIQVTDEGNSGALSMPPSTSAPATPTNKLYNTNNVLYWNDAQVGTCWNRTGTDVHLINTGDNVGIGVTDPGAKLEINGQVKITGSVPDTDKILTSDANGLASWQTVHRPKANYVGGNSYLDLLATPQLVRSVSINVPAAGVIYVSAAGYADWEGTGEDRFRLCISDSSSPDMDSNHLVEVSDYGCTDDTDQYTCWRIQRGFTVSTAGDYTYYLWADARTITGTAPPGDCGGDANCEAHTELGDVSMWVKYWPTE